MNYAEFYKNGYYITSNRNLASDSRTLIDANLFGNGATHTFFGEFINEGILVNLGEISILEIESYNTQINYDLFKDINGPIDIIDEVSVVNEVSIL